MNDTRTSPEQAGLQHDEDSCDKTESNDLLFFYTENNIVEEATHSVLTALRELLLTGDIPAGEKLRTEALVDRLGFSRTPIRSALAILASQSLVRYESNRGYSAREFSLAEIFCSLESRSLLEGLAARICAELDDRSNLVRVLNVIQLRLANVAGSDWTIESEKEWYAEYYAFHRTISHATGSLSLRASLRATITLATTGDPIRISPFIRPLVRPEKKAFPHCVPSYIHETLTQHESLIGLIERGQGVRAEAVMREHVMQTKDRIREALLPQYSGSNG